MPVSQSQRDGGSLSGSEQDEANISQQTNETEVAFLKRKNRALQQALGRLDVNLDSTLSGGTKRIKTAPVSLTQPGRGIRKVADLYHELDDLVNKADMHSALEVLSAEDLAELDSIEFMGMREEEIVAEKKDRKRCFRALQIINTIVPKFQEKATSALDLVAYLRPLQTGSGDARSEDTSRLKVAVADWLNNRQPGPSPAIVICSREMRGMNNDTTWRLLTPITYNWDDPEVRIKLQNSEPGFDMGSSFLFCCLYEDEEGNKDAPRRGFLQGPLLVRVYKHIFTSPSSAKDENSKPKSRRRHVAKTLRISGRVTPRSLAYAAVQLVFALCSAPDWTALHAGIHFPTFYNFLVDFFEDPASPEHKKSNDELLQWWNERIFPKSATANKSSPNNALANSQKLLA